MSNFLKYHRSLKKSIEKNTLWSFGISLTSIMLLFLSFSLNSEPVYELYAPLKKVKEVTEIINIFKEKKATENIGGSGSIPKNITDDITKSSKIKAVKVDTLIKHEIKKIAPDLNKIIEKSEFDDISLSNIGNGIGEGNKPGFGSGDGSGKVFSRISGDGDESNPKIPKIDDVPEVDINASVDLLALQKSINYPVQAKRMGVEGKITVAVLISDRGKVVQHKILEEGNLYLQEEAVRVVLNAKYSPAQKDGKNVYSWVIIPVKFRLK